MKKILLFLSSVAFVASVYAGSYIPTEIGSITGGSQITSVDGVTLTFGASGNTFTFATLAMTYNSIAYTGYFGGSTNPTVGTDLIPTAGTFYKFDMTKSGSLDIGYVLNASKAFYIIEVSGTTINALVNGTTVATKAYTGATITVTSGNSYYVYCAGSKLGFYGFTFTEGSPTKVTNLTTSDVTVVKTEYFSTKGAKLEEPVKGVNIVKETMSNGKVVITKIIK